MLLRVACCIAVLSVSANAFAQDASKPPDPLAEPPAPQSEPPLDIGTGMAVGFTVGGAMATAGFLGIPATLDAFPEGERDNDRFKLAFGFSLIAAIGGVTLTGVTVAVGVSRIREELPPAVVSVAPVPGGAVLTLSGAF